MDSKKIEEAAKALSSLSYTEWVILRSGVDMAFDKNKRELERNLKLSSTDEVAKAIRGRFG